ncbi:MAG: isoprenylcysteine carboxylmethyltransferase family protein, partial [Hyphomicrobiaceae bacterium]|nr:isoprenylcysteine carboxylmethyltransferase family protein [Hyphomicrobiaceae bacterium]
MKPDDTDRPNTHHWPPILYVVVVVVAWGLGLWVPLPSIFDSAYAKVVGWLLFAIGGAVGVIALVHFRRVGTPFDPTAA